MEDIHQLLSSLAHSHERCVLATIIQVEGSAYRKAGTSALFMGDGMQIGVISAGCLDNDLAARVPCLLSAQTSQCVVFDMSTEDDLSWGKGAGCHGVVHVLLEPVDDEYRAHLIRAKWYLDQRIPVSLARQLSMEYSTVSYLFLPERGSPFGTWGKEIPVGVRQLCLDKRRFSQQGTLCYNRDCASFVHIQHFWPKPRLILFGSGRDVQPLASIAAQTGFAVIVGNRQSASASESNFPLVDALYVGHWTEVLDQVQLTAQDSVVVMTHQFEEDRFVLNLLRSYPLLYLGVMGPRQRTARLLPVADIPEQLHAPVGLPIGAEGPEEIAISILAEVIRTIRNHRQSRSLR